MGRNKKGSKIKLGKIRLNKALKEAMMRYAFRARLVEPEERDYKAVLIYIAITALQTEFYEIVNSDPTLNEKEKYSLTKLVDNFDPVQGWAEELEEAVIYGAPLAEWRKGNSPKLLLPTVAEFLAVSNAITFLDIALSFIEIRQKEARGRLENAKHYILQAFKDEFNHFPPLTLGELLELPEDLQHKYEILWNLASEAIRKSKE